MALFRLYKNSLTPMHRKRKRSTSPAPPDRDPREKKIKKHVSSYVVDESVKESKNGNRRRGRISSGPSVVRGVNGKVTKDQRLSGVRGKSTSTGDWWTELGP